MMAGPPFEIDTKATCLLCVSPNCPPIVEKRREEGDELNFDKLNATKRGFRVLLRYLKVDFKKLSGFATAFHRPFVKSSQVNLSVSLCNDCSSVTNDFFELFQTFENIRIQLDLCVKQLHEFIEKGRKDEDRLRKYKEQTKAGNIGELGLAQSNIAEELRSEVQKKCSLKLERSLPRIMVTNCQNSCDIRPTGENGSQRGRNISGSFSEDSGEEKDIIPTRTTTLVPNNKSGVKRNTFLDSIAKIKARAVKNKQNKGINGKSWFKKFAKFEKSETHSWKCILCGKGFNHQTTFKDHLMSIHLPNYFSEKIPAGVSPRQVENAIAYFVSEGKVSTDLAKEGKGSEYRCRFCKQKCGINWKMKMHILRKHFEEVIQNLESVESPKVLPHTSIIVPNKPKELFETSGGVWKCLECGKELATSNSFNTHYRRFHSEISGQHQPRKCFECNKILKHKGWLERHRMINHPMNYFGRRIPPAISESRLESSLAHFVGKVQASEWASRQNGDIAEKCPCPFCKKGMHYTKRSELRYHFLRRHFSAVTEHAGKEIETTSGDNDLGETFGNKHRRRLQRSGTTLTNCEHCGRTFNSNFHLRRHLISDHSYNFFKHRLPEEVSKEGLEKGLASMMKKLELTPKLGFSFECSLCGRRCRNRWTMRMHLLLAHFNQVVESSVTITSNSAALNTKFESEPVVAFEVVPGLKTEHRQNVQVKWENMDEDEEMAMTITEPFVAKVEPDTVDDIELEMETETEAKTKSKKCEKLKNNVCAICKKVFANPERKRQHYRLVHLRIGSNGKRKRHAGKCELCGKIYSQAQYLFKHKLQVHPIEFLKDKLPSGVTKKQLNEAVECVLENMTQLSNEDEGQNKNIFECPFCNTKRTEKVNLKIHLLQYHLEKVVHKIGEPRSRPKRRSSLSLATAAPGRQKCEHCKQYVAFKHGNHRKHLMLEHPLILYKDRLPQGISENDFEEALRRVQAAMKVLPKNRSDPRHFVECTLCSKKMRKHPRDSRFHVLWCHLDQVLREVEMIHGGNPLSPEHILPD